MMFHSSNKILFAHGGQAVPDKNGIIQFKLTDVGEGIAECEMLKWFIKEGDQVQQFQKVCEVSSDKANVEITSRYDGIVTKLHYKIGDMAKVGTPLVDIKVAGAPASTSASPSPTSAAPAAATTPAATSTPTTSTTTNTSGKAVATPAVRFLAKEHNINLATIVGTGRDGRVMKEDILRIINGQTAPAPSKQETPTPTPTPVVAAPKYEPLAEDKRVPLRGMTRIMAKTMTASNAVPHFGYCDEIIMDGLVDLRKHMKQVFERRGTKIKITYMPIIIKATSLALAKYPVLNSSVSEDLSEMVLKASHNIGIAMDTPQGLIVPNIKNVQNKTILDIAEELNRLQKLGLEGKLAPEDLKSGTFTLSNIGAIGGTYAKPVIMLPEVAIGALGKIQRLPRYVDNTDVVKPVHLMQVSWSADHRVIDGATMARFSNLWKEYIEHPESMLMDLA